MAVAEELLPHSPDPPGPSTARQEDPMNTSSSSLSPTPSYSTSSLVFYHREVKLALAISNPHFAHLEAQKNAFLSSCSSTEDPRSPLTLALTFLDFLTAQQCVSPSIISAVLRAFHCEFLDDETEIHSIITTLTNQPDERERWLGIYYRTIEASDLEHPAGDLQRSRHRLGAIFQHVKTDGFKIMAVFGGQGESSRTCAKDLARLYTAYKPMLHRLIGVIGPQLYELSTRPEFRLFFKGKHLDLKSWLNDPTTIPNSDFISRAPISVPIIGALGLARYCIVCRILGLSPGELRSLFQSTTGHSQGLLVSVVIAMSNSWESFYSNCHEIIEVLFYLGWECHCAAPYSAVPAKSFDDATHRNAPSYMLSVRGLERNQLKFILEQINTNLPSGQHVCLALVNAHDQFVVAGPTASLVHLDSFLTTISSFGKEQSRVPFSRRKPYIQHSFIPVSTPFHTPYLKKAAESLNKQFADRVIHANQLELPVFHTRTGMDISEGAENILPIVLEAIACEMCDWPSALDGQDPASGQPSLSHIVVFDCGGLGPLVKKAKEGWGVRVIQAGDLDSRDPDLGTLHDLLSPDLLHTSTRLQSWSQKFQPRLILGTTPRLETRLSRLLGAPPIIVAGMTPTTAHSDFVAAIMNAGYHVELAGGGYHNAPDMSAAIQDLVRDIPPGRGITCNLIYADPRAMAWQIALIRRLSRTQVPIDGLTIGAGVPSLQVAREYIQTLGLRYIGFKPGSLVAIRQVVDIAKEHPEFPIMLQWTGGRGGGHHSYEDFHEPLLATYALIRQQANIYLIAGSGFGSGESIYPYLTGSWSLQMGYPMMPFDGVLLGSRMMVAEEAHTSAAVRKIIINTPGVPDCDWEQTYSGPSGGIVTVRSEMGEPIHKIATRGVRLWAIMDANVFNKPPRERTAYLTQNRDSIIRRLNADFAKPWFGRTIHGDVVNLEDMSYLDVLHRVIQLMYIHHQRRWVASSYVDFTMTIASRWLERLPTLTTSEAELSSAVLTEAPDYFLISFAERCPTASQDSLNPEDLSFFLMECKKPGRKPVNFIPALNEDFEYYFKKDSLWQAENIDAVVEQDAERVCILHGPVAAQYSREENESAKDILDSITTSIINRMQQEVPVDDLMSSSDSGLITPATWSTISTGKDAAEGMSTTSFTTLSEPLDDHSVSSEAVSLRPSRTFPVWLRALIENKILSQGQTRRKNPFYRLMQTHPESVTQFDEDCWEISISQAGQIEGMSCIRTSSPNGTDILIEVHPPTGSDPLSLLYKFHPSCATFGLSEVMEGRNERIRSFYSKLWLGKDVNPCLAVQETFHGPQMTLTQSALDELILIAGSAFPDHRSLAPGSGVLPISFGIIIAWGVICRPLLLSAVDGDLLRLVHRSNTFEYCVGATPLRLGDTVGSTSRVQAVYTESAGKVVIVEGRVIRSGVTIMLVTSTFLFRSSAAQAQGVSAFHRDKESEWTLYIDSKLEESVLFSRDWFHPHDRSVSLVGNSITLRITTNTRRRGDGLENIHVTGRAFAQLGGNQQIQVGTVEFSYDGCVGNPVLDFVKRKGKSSRRSTNFTDPGWSGTSSIEVQMPASNHPYAQLSKDFNPIHVCSVFSSLADVPGTICHGMCTSAIVERALEHLVLEGDRERLRRFEARFTGMVMPLENLVIGARHEGMVDGRMRIGITAVRKGSEEVLLEADAEVEQPTTAYLFTGQGSQSKGMGMDLYRTSSVAKDLWDRVDQQLYDAYGWSVLDIVRNNPKSLTLHFGGQHGRTIRQKYLSITTETLLPDGTRVQRPVLAGLGPNSTCCTFTNPRGLLYSTQFAQPAILLFEAAVFAELRSRGYVGEGVMYAGHSLGEYGALSALSQYIPTGALVELAFYRGLVMQASVARDGQRITYGMVAANPKRVGKFFDQAALSCLVRAIAESSKELLEIVNFNVEGEQYVCSGTTANLYILGKLIDHVATNPEGLRLVEEVVRCPDTTTTELSLVIAKFQDKVKTLPQPIQLERGKATIPLEGIDVPFHSSHLRGTVEKFRQCLLRPGFLVDKIDVEQLVGKFIPNLMAKPFSLDEAYIREAYSLTQSPILEEILGL